MKKTHVAIVGAGPYGLSVGNALSQEGTEVLVIGKPLQTWYEMPEGLFLRSRITKAFNPFGDGSFPLFLHERGLPFSDNPPPISRALFLEYAEWFLSGTTFPLRTERVVQVDSMGDAFILTLGQGESVTAQAVVMATGIQSFAALPEEYATLPPHMVSHTRDAFDLSRYANTRVAVLGGRQAGFEWAALIAEAGAQRVDIIYNHATPQFVYPDWSWLKTIIEGTQGDRAWFRQLSPDEQRAVRDRLWTEGRGKVEPWVHPRIAEHNVHMHPATSVTSVRTENNAVVLTLSDTKTLFVDAIVCATGYRPSVHAVQPLAESSLLPRIRTHDGHYPVLNDVFESSVPNLFFVGYLADTDFGPLVGHMNLCEVSARILARHLQSLRRS
ncbi:hypothetical protein EBR66_06220 [bacterium]|nr:hypothetical protein [bacterium]